MNGVLFVINWYGQVVYSDLLIAIGAVLIVFALIPSSWIEKAARLPAPN